MNDNMKEMNEKVEKKLAAGSYGGNKIETISYHGSTIEIYSNKGKFDAYINGRVCEIELDSKQEAIRSAKDVIDDNAGIMSAEEKIEKKLARDSKVGWCVVQDGVVADGPFDSKSQAEAEKEKYYKGAEVLHGKVTDKGYFVKMSAEEKIEKKLAAREYKNKKVSSVYRGYKIYSYEEGSDLNYLIDDEGRILADKLKNYSDAVKHIDNMMKSMSAAEKEPASDNAAQPVEATDPARLSEEDKEKLKEMEAEVKKTFGIKE